MTDDAAEVRRVLAPLRDRPVSVDAERLAARRARVVGALKRDVRAFAEERKARPRRRAALAVLSLAAAASLLVGARFLTQHGAGPSQVALTFVGSVGDTVAGVSARHLQAGESLSQDPGEIQTAEQGSAELVNQAGLGLHLGAATRVSLAGLVGANASKNQVELRQGSVTCSVPHLGDGQRFSVSTPDARVVVHGTVFSVQVDGTRSSGAETCVKVTDGVVIVQHGDAETALNAGDSWGCAGSATAATPTNDSLTSPSNATPSTDATDSADATDGSSEPSHAVHSGRVNERGTLGDESRLLQNALAFERLGNKAKAQSELNRLLSKYPSSPLAPEARRALARLASGAGQ